MPALDSSERRLVQDVVGNDTVLYATVVRLFLASPDPRAWSYAGKWGAMALTHSAGAGFAFKLVDLNSAQVAWDFGLARDPLYADDAPQFHSFAGPGCMVGLAFADDGDARNFRDAVLNRESRLAMAGSSRPAPSPRPSPAPSPASTPTTTQPSSGLLGGMFGSKASKKTVKKSDISAPTGFQHLSHIGYTKGKGFDVQNIPPEWKETLARAGVTEADLHDKKTAKFIANFMEQHGGEKPTRRPPPPPPSRRQPPPPPPPRGGAPAPPPIPPSAPAPPPVPSLPPSYGSAPAPPPPPPVGYGGGAPPPPPPPPPVGHGGGAPAPPPPPPMGYGGGAPPPPPPPPAASGGGAPSDLLASIRAGTSLKAVGSAPAPPPAPVETGGDDIASALANALAARKAAMSGDDEEEEEDEDDDEWK